MMRYDLSILIFLKFIFFISFTWLVFPLFLLMKSTLTLIGGLVKDVYERMAERWFTKLNDCYLLYTKNNMLGWTFQNVLPFFSLGILPIFLPLSVSHQISFCVLFFYLPLFLYLSLSFSIVPSLSLSLSLYLSLYFSQFISLFLYEL